MSGRAKLIFLFILLALIATAVTFGILTWDVKELLRFQAVSYERDDEPAPGREEVGTLWVQVENTSNAPVVLYEAALVRAPFGYVNSLELPPPHTGQMSAVAIPAGHTIHTKVVGWNPRGEPLKGFEDVTVSYCCISKTRNYWLRFHIWAHDNALGRWEISLPNPEFPFTEASLLPANSETAK